MASQTPRVRSFPPSPHGEGRRRSRQGGDCSRKARRMASTTPLTFSFTDLFQNLSTRSPSRVSTASRSLSCAACSASPWTLPSTSITSLAEKQTKSRKYPRNGACRRKWKPSMRNRFNADQRRRSHGVSVLRISRARRKAAERFCAGVTSDSPTLAASPPSLPIRGGKEALRTALTHPPARSPQARTSAPRVAPHPTHTYPAA
ncbi:MAG: hypothetical protein JWM33_2787 [Caulobacteraceae bacterium]|nr:hypothetical protein [Caulobacteraceae bacterium]